MVMSFASPVAMAQKKNSKAKTTAQAPKKKSSGKKTTTANTKKPSKQKAPDVNDLKKKRDAAQTKIKQSQAQLEKNRREVKKQLGNLAVVNAEIEKHERTIVQVKGQLDSVNNNIRDLEQQLSVLGMQLKECKLKYARSMLYLYKNRKTSNKMLFLLSAKDFRQMARRYRYVTEYSKYQRVAGEAVKRKQDEIEQAKAKLDEQKQTHTALLREQEQENARLAAKQTEQKTAVDALQKKQKELQSVIAANQKEMQKLNSQIDYYVKLAIEQERQRKAEAERKRKAEEERKAREAQRKAEAEKAAAQRAAAAKSAAANSAAGSTKGSTAASKGSASAGNSATTTAKTAPAATKSTAKAETPAKYQPNDKEYALTSNFAANKGRLPMPITGSYLVSTHFGNYSMKGVNVQLNSKGINLTGQPGAQARCIYDGEVVAVFTTSGLKNVMVRHGSYISVYCNLSSVSVRQGQRVSARQNLGAVANDASGKPNLYFQLQNEAATLNPESWLAR